MSPPELTADAPVLDVLQPIAVGVDKLLGYKLYGILKDCL